MKSLVFCLVVVTFFAFASSARAEDVLVFHFESQDGNLRLDSQQSPAIVLESDPNFSVVAFSQEVVRGEYRIEFSDVTGASAVKYEFSGKKGKFSYEFPHFGIVNGYKIYSVGSGALLLEGSLADFVQCNADNICEFEKGETLLTCLSDCISGSFSDETKKLLKQNNDVLRDPKSGEVVLRGMQASAVASTGGTAMANNGAGSILVIVGGIAVVLISVGVVVLIRLRARNKRYGL
ncbi:MAG: hypothetical protein IPK84_02590 [Candidatus Moraniibacteriota bacterium]|nr:MAG: hypothetical protein IPK84_02590 [Candidatus Moranbacteria bacterium]